MSTEQNYLNAIFFYDEEDGDLYYRSSGMLATSDSDGRYSRINIGYGYGRKYVHHVIWCMAYGQYPIKNIDHKDGNGFNNRLDNLRECIQSDNMANADWGALRCIERHGRKFRVRPVFIGTRYNVGSFDTIEEAVVAYKKWAEKFHGEFAFHNRE